MPSNTNLCNNCPYEKHLGFSCCAIYREDNMHVGRGEKDRIAYSNEFHKNRANYGVEPQYDITEEERDYCEYFSEEEKGCTIPRENRSEPCLEYECYYMKVDKNTIRK